MIGRGVAQGGAQAGEKLADGEGLFDIIVGAEIQRGDLLGFLVAGGQDDDGRFC